MAIEYELIRVVDLDEAETAIEDDDCFLVDSERYDLEVPKYIKFVSMKKAMFRAAKDVAMTGGEAANTVTFSTAFVAGFVLHTKCTSGETRLEHLVQNRTAAGFEVVVDQDCTLEYIAVVPL